MATKFYLDKRGSKEGKPASLKLAINKDGDTALLSLDVRIQPEEWDKNAERVVSHPSRNRLNTFIARKRIEADDVIIGLREKGVYAKMSAVEVKRAIERSFSNAEEDEQKETFISRFRKFSERKSESTRSLYMQTYRHILRFDSEIEEKGFEDITKDWLMDFDEYLSRTSPAKNARNIHFRNIRSVFNDAIDDEITTFYPFRKFKIRPVATVKRSLSVEQLRELFNYTPEEYAVRYLDMFKLTFFLVGINVVDLCRLTEITGEGRVEYYRAKTKRLYSIKLEPEALEIINRYRGKGQLLNLLDEWPNYRNFNLAFNRALKNIGEMEISGQGGKKNRKPLFPDLSSYWARHSWATVAAELDIPKETIAAALGHGGNSVTDIYIDFNQKKVDEANRRVIDWVLYNKR